MDRDKSQHSTYPAFNMHWFHNNFPKVLFEPEFLPTVSISTSRNDSLQQPDWDTLVVPVTEEECMDFSSGAAPELVALDKQASGTLSAIVTMNEFKVKQGEVTYPAVFPAGSSKVCQVLLVGLGKCDAINSSDWGPSAFQAAGTAIATAARSYQLQSVHVSLRLPLVAAAAAAAAAVTGLVSAVLVGLYEGSIRYKSKPESKVKLEKVVLLLPPAVTGEAAAAAAAAAAEKGVAVARGILTARFLVEAPANVCTPTHLAAAAAHIAALSPDRLQLQVLDVPQCEELGMGLFLGVGRGSDEPLKFIHLTYTPPGPVAHKVALVGKGLTFDSGGYNLKVQGGIETMKCDMGGAGAVLGAARALVELQPLGVEVHFITAACENMVSGKATKPSDIHVSAAGLTVEVNDTDAEGRLTLADALWYAQAVAGATVVVDIATLTGAAGIALGNDTGALFANSDSLAAALDAASKTAGEKFWRMPLNRCLKKQLESPIADMKNYAGRSGGAITAALFLQEFVKEGCQWLHLDVAGPAWDDAAGLPTGFGAATLTELVMHLSAQQAQ